MKYNPVKPDSYQNAINMLEFARDLAGDLLYGVKNVEEIAAIYRGKGINRANIAIYVLEQAGALPGIAKDFKSPMQEQGADAVSRLLTNRYFQRPVAGYIYSLFESKNIDWLKAFSHQLARNNPTGYLYLLRYKPEPCELVSRPDMTEILKKVWISGLATQDREMVVQEAIEQNRLANLFKQTGWDECLPGMKTGKNRRTLLVMDMRI